MREEQLFEAAGMEADQEFHRLARHVGKAVSDARRRPHKVTRLQVEHLVAEQEPKVASSHQKGLFDLAMEVGPEVHGRVCQGERSGRDDILHQGVATASLVAEHKDCAVIGAILEGHAPIRPDHSVLIHDAENSAATPPLSAGSHQRAGVGLQPVQLQERLPLETADSKMRPGFDPLAAKSHDAIQFGPLRQQRRLDQRGRLRADSLSERLKPSAAIGRRLESNRPGQLIRTQLGGADHGKADVLQRIARPG